MLESLDYLPFVIFTTAFDEYPLKAFEVSALDYLLKPVEHKRLAEAIRKVLERNRNNVAGQNCSQIEKINKVFVKDGERCWFVKLEKIRLLQIKDVDLTNCTVRIEQGKGKKDRYVLFPMPFRGELAQYIEKQKRGSAKCLFESNRLGSFSTRRNRQIIKEYSDQSGIEK